MSDDDALAVARAEAAASTAPRPRHLDEAEGLARLYEALGLLDALVRRGVLTQRPEWLLVASAIARAGHALEDATDLERPPRVTDVVARVVEPELGPVGDALARLLGHACAPGRDDAVAAVAEACASVAEGDLTAALLACDVAGFELPRPHAAVFSPERHQLVERGAGPKDLVVTVERAGRIGQGGRLVRPAQVVVGSGA